VQILLVEDEAMLAESMLRWLEDVCGASARWAHDLSQARGALAEGLPLLVICDNHLPDGLGVEFLAQVKQEHPEVVCALWSGLLDRETRQAAAGLDACLSKGLGGLDGMGDLVRSVIGPDA
jgi:DNA-binding response OmpR family regulator